VFDEAQLGRVLRNYTSYYNQVRTHLSLVKSAPDFRRPQKIGRVAAIPILGGLHHQYVRAWVLTRHRPISVVPKIRASIKPGETRPAIARFSGPGMAGL
jgi:hypothetical protein